VVAKTKLDQLEDFLLNMPDEHDESMLIEELDGSWPASSSAPA
jgi:hypothetical protein